MSSSILGKTALKRMLTDALRKGPWSDRQIDVMIESLWREQYSMRTSGYAIAGGTDAEIFWNEATRTFTIQPVDYENEETPGIKFAFYTFAYKLHYHKKYLPHTVQLPDEEGLYCIYFDQDETTKEWELTYLKNPTDAQIRDIYLNRVITAWLYWAYDLQEAIYFGDSRHGSEWNPQMHWMLHQTINSQRQSGLALNNVTYDGEGDENGDYQFGISAGELWHDDIFATTDAVGVGDGLPVWYFDAAGDPRFVTADSGKKFLNTGTGRVAHNSATGGLAEAPDQHFVAYHLFATNCTLHPHISVTGQASFDTLGAAVGSIEAEVATLRQDLPHANLMHIGSFVLQTSDAFTNTGKAIIVYTSATEDVFVSDTDFDTETGILTLHRSANRPPLKQPLDISSLVIDAVNNFPETIIEIISNVAQQIVQTGMAGAKESYLIPDYIGTTYTQLSSWFVIAPNENVGNFKATVMVRDKVTNDIFTLQNVLTFDYTDPLNEVEHDNEVVLSPPVDLALGIDANKRLYATLTGMHVTDNERIHFCFERCANNPQTLTLDHVAGEGTIHEPTLESEASLTLEHLEGEGTVHEVTAEEGPTIEDINYGLLYNWFAITDSRKISSNDDWKVPLTYDASGIEYTYYDLRVYLGGTSVAGGKLKETGLIFWNTPNTGATNQVNFNARGGGERSGNDGSFRLIKERGYYWARNMSTDGVTTWGLALGNESAGLLSFGGTKQTGVGLRLFNENTILTDGEEGTYTGNDGKIYRTICIDGIEWTADSLAETKYRNGNTIPEVTDATTWAGLTSGALCAYNNDWNNV